MFEAGVLNSIYFYNDQVDGFKKFQGKLPYQLNFSMNNAKVVSLLGEPAKKNPKNNSTAIWIEYPALGLQVTFVNNSYEDIDNPIAHICIFQKS